MNVFVDDDGRAYVFYSSEGNWTMYVVRLNEDFTGPETPAVENKTWARIFVRDCGRRLRRSNTRTLLYGHFRLHRLEAKPGGIRRGGEHLGPWKKKGDPCVGPEAKTTFGSQSTFVLPVPGQAGPIYFHGRPVESAKPAGLALRVVAVGPPAGEFLHAHVAGSLEFPCVDL